MIGTVQVAQAVQHGASTFPPRGQLQKEAPEGVEPSRRFPDTRFTAGMFVCFCRWTRLPEHPAGLEPARTPWKGGTLPLTSWVLLCSPGCQRTAVSRGSGRSSRPGFSLADV